MSRYRTLFLDLDDTLYPSANGLWQAIGDRILAYMTERLAIPAEKANALRAEYFRSHGTTLNGLRIHFQVDPYDYLDFVHDIPINDLLQPDPELRDMLAILPQKRVVFTNASLDHAKRILSRLGIEHEIDQVIDIITLEFQNKPKPSAYQRALSLAGEYEPYACLMVDDRVINLFPGKAIGMTTVVVGDSDTDPRIDFRISRITELTKTVPDLDHGFTQMEP